MSRPMRSRKSAVPKAGRRMLAESPAASPGGLTPTESRRRPRPTSGTAGLPPLVARQVQREMDRLRRLPAGAPEAAQVRAYLHCLWSLPWQRSTGENTDLRAVERILDREHLGLHRAKERIIEYLADADQLARVARARHGEPAVRPDHRVGHERRGRADRHR